MYKQNSKGHTHVFEVEHFNDVNTDIFPLHAVQCTIFILQIADGRIVSSGIRRYMA